MLSRRTSLTSVIAALGVGAAITLSVPTSASAADVYGDHVITMKHCKAVQKIELLSYDGVLHDAQEVVPVVGHSYCVYTLEDNGRTVWRSQGGAASGWRYDGPGHHMCAFVTDLLINLPNTAEGVCN